MKKRADRITDIITLEKLAEELGVGMDTIEKWREKGMPVIKIDRYVRVFRGHVLEWIVTHGEIMNREEIEETLWNRKNQVS